MDWFLLKGKHLEVTYRIGSKCFLTGRTIHLSQDHPLEYEGLTLDFKRGTITCSRPRSYKILEYVTFSFSVALLQNGDQESL